MHTISSSVEKVSEGRATLDGEGEGVRTVSQGEPLMQEQRENERNAGTDAIREEAIASESMDVNEAEKERLFQQHYRAEIESISLDADTFTHPV